MQTTESGLVIPRGCERIDPAEFDEGFAERIVLDGLAAAGCYQEGSWSFADDKPGDEPATLKVVADPFYEHPFWSQLLLATYLAYPCLQSADVLAYAPDGTRDFATILGRLAGKPVAHARRIPGGAKHDYEFMTPDDLQLAGGAQKLFMVEDITSTLSSPAAMRQLIAEAQVAVQGIDKEAALDLPVHVLSMLLRGKIKEVYRRGLVFHSLAELAVPRNANEFRRLFGIEPVPTR